MSPKICNCNRVLTAQDIKVCDNYLMQFCTKFERLYGKQAVTPNMHLHGHLAECMLDYGPIYSFWLFSFERYNGLLGNMPTNKKSIEIQFMNRFCRESIIITKELPDHGKATFGPLIGAVSSANLDRGALSEMFSLDFIPYIKLSSRCTNYSNVEWAVNNVSAVTCSGSKSKYTFTDQEYKCLKDCYKTMYPKLNDETVFIPLSCWKNKIIHANKELYGSQGSRSHRSSYITENQI